MWIYWFVLNNNKKTKFKFTEIPKVDHRQSDPRMLRIIFNTNIKIYFFTYIYSFKINQNKVLSY